ncbi:MAG TPA: ABC transporter permease [Dehalococcoidia bacterium]|nr:ABC transporter permease [Dehalococcoidia bacterium]
MAGIDRARGSLPGGQTVRRAWRRLVAVVHRDRIDRELDEDVRAHLELAERDARSAGLSPDEARRAALQCFGPIQAMKEAHRDERGLPGLEHLVRDVRYGLRAMGRSPRFAAVAVCTLALGIGANTAIFSVVDAVLLRPLPYRDADRLVTIASNTGPGMRREAFTAVSYPDYQDISRLTDAVAGAAAYSNDRYNLIDAGEPREVQVTRATPNLLSVLGISPVVGRGFTAGEAHAPVAIVSHALWLSDFGGDMRALGRPIFLDGKPFTIIGVMPGNVPFPDASTEAWIPIWWGIADAPAMAEMRLYRAFSMVARLAPGASLGKLRDDLDLLGKHITASGEATSKFGTGERFAATALRDQVAGDARQPLLILFGAVALVLLIACVNAANLLVARANGRQKEFAVRRAIGAGRWALVRQLLVESVLLALAAGIVGLLLAAAGLDVLAAQLPHGYVAGIDGRVLGFTVVLATATGLGFGIVPALRASAPALDQSIRDGAGATVGRSHRRARNLLIVSEIALALVLLVGSALLVRSFIAVTTINPGFNPQGLLTARIRLTPERYPTVSQKRAFFAELVQRLRTQPGVSAITFSDGAPLSGRRRMVGTNPQRIRPEDPDQFLAVEAIAVGPDYFSTMRIPILQGRGIAADDEREGAPPVCVVSKSLADRLWPGRNPIGQPGMGRRDDVKVVGVVSDVRSESLERAGGLAVYSPTTDDDRAYDEMWLVLRSAHPLRVAPALQAAVRSLDATQPIAEIATYDQIIQQQYARLRLITALITLFAALALVLAVIGIAGVTAYAVSQRTRELGIRIALGARTIDVLRLLLSETVLLVVIGLGIGSAAAFGSTRVLRSLLYGVTSTDPTTFGAAALALGLVALVATYVPARRAGRVDPVVALRNV